MSMNLISTPLSTLLIGVLVFLLVAALPAWPHSSRWGFGPGAAIGLALLITVVLTMAGQI
jgi:uncharacterized protein DUF3309